MQYVTAFKSYVPSFALHPFATCNTALSALTGTVKVHSPGSEDCICFSFNVIIQNSNCRGRKINDNEQPYGRKW